MEDLRLPRFALEARPGESPAVLRVSGELDVATAPALGDAVEELWRAGCPSVALDLAAVAFIDSTGLGALLTLCRAAERAGRRVAISVSCASLERLIAVSGLERMVPRA